MELLENGFCEIDGIDPALAKMKGSPNKEVIKTNINPKGA